MANTSWGALLWFFVVVALIPVALWLLKRSPLTALGGAAGRAGTPRTVSVLPLSPQQKLVTIEVGHGEERLWLVLGVTPHSIRTVHTMAPQAAPQAEPAAPPAATFAQLLGRLKQAPGRGPDDHAR
jgi:flagellar protein FliO/FliZ